MLCACTHATAEHAPCRRAVHPGDAEPCLGGVCAVPGCWCLTVNVVAEAPC